MTARTRWRGKAAVSAYVLMVVVGMAVAAALGGVASLFYPENRLVGFAVFAACTAGPALALSWAVFVSRHTVERESHAEDNVEGRWYDRAISGAFHDILVVCGLGATALAVTRIEISGLTVLTLVLVLVTVDVAIRYRIECRRGA